MRKLPKETGVAYIRGADRDRYPIQLSSAERAEGADFCTKLVKEFEIVVINSGKPVTSLLEDLHDYAYSGKRFYSETPFAFENFALKDFYKLISLIAEKAYLSLLTREEMRKITGLTNSDITDDLRDVAMRAGGLSEGLGKRYTHIDADIAKLANKISTLGLPNNMSLSFGSAENGIFIHTRDPYLQEESMFDWQLSGWLKLGGLGIGTAATAISCAPQQPPAEVAPLPPTEENVEEQSPVTEEAPTAAPELSEIDAHITPTAEAPATALVFAQNFDQLTILTIDAEDAVKAGASENLGTVKDAIRRKLGNDVTIEVRSISNIWVAVAKDNETGQIWFAVGTKSGSIFPQLMAIGDEVESDDDFEMQTRPLCDGCVEHVLASTGTTVTIVGIDAEGNPREWMNQAGEMVRIEAEIEFPTGLAVPTGAYYLNETHIVNKDGKPLYVLPTKEGEWIKDYERSLDSEGFMDLNRFRENQLTMADIDEEHIEKFFEGILKPEFQEKTDWSKVEDWPFVAAGGYFKYWADKTNNVIKFPDPKTAPFIKDTGFCGELVVGENHYLYILFALRDVDNQSNDEYFNLAAPLQKDGVPLTPTEIKDLIRILEEQMNFFIIGFDATPIGATQEDPLFSPQVNGERDLMTEIIVHIAKNSITGDVSRVSELNHLIFLTQGIEFSEDEYGGILTNSYK